MINLRLPLDPVPAARPRFGKGFTYTPKNYRDFKNLAAILIRQKYASAPMTGPLEVCVVFNIKKPKWVKRDYPCVKPDIDNFVKAIFDSCNKLLWEDDAQIVDLHSFKVYGDPSITISIKEKQGEV